MAENIKIVLGDDVPPAVLRNIKRRIFQNFGKYLVDFFKFPVFTDSHIEQLVEIRGIEHLDKSLDRGNGAVLVSLHLGNWELGGAVLSSMKYPLNALVLSHENESIDKLFREQRQLNGLKSISLGTSVRKLFSVLAKNELVAIVADKLYGSKGIGVEFFGKKAFLPKGPAVFALKTGAPIMVVTLIRKQDDTFCLNIEPPLFYEKKKKITDEDIRNVIADYIVYFEKYVYENIDQWYAFKRIWKPQEKTQ